MKKIIISFALILFVITSCDNNSSNSNLSITIPAAGNCWIDGDTLYNSNFITKNGLENWGDKNRKARIYFRLAKSGKLNIDLTAKVDAGKSKIKCTLNDASKEFEVSSESFDKVNIDSFEIENAGYNYVELEGISKEGAVFADVKNIILSGEAVDTNLIFVKDDFYWGRRGPSVHLSFPVSEDKGNVKWFYSEITVPEDNDVIGSYFMANGFAQGYFGIQVNSASERRILFSVWSPYKTQNPDEIPEDYKIKMLKKGDGVYTGEFGNEGSGGQSYLRYNWKSETTYRFLLKGEPIDSNNTVFTAYFFTPELNEWKLIASFQRPYTKSYLTRLHSFLENFYTTTGEISRMAYYTNQWVCNTAGEWFELNEARFTADATARKNARLDFAGGLKDGEFFMKNCGFFNETTKIGSHFERELKGKKTQIDFNKLP